MQYATLDQLRAAAERDVEVQGMTFRVRRVTPLEMFEAFGTVQVVPEDEPSAKAAKITPAKAKALNVRASKLLVLGLVAPPVTEADLHLIPDAAWGPLVNTIAELSGLTRPFAGGEPASASS